MDLVLRATFVFFLVFLVTRVIGRRELSSLEPFDLILLIVIGDLIQQGVTQSDYSLTGVALVISTVVLLQVLVSYAGFRLPRIRPALDGEPIIVLQDGKVIQKNLDRERLTAEEVAEQARMQQIESLDDVKWAVLETNGQLSFIQKD